MESVTIKFSDDEQYKRFIEKIKDDVLKEFKPQPAYHPTWVSIRTQMEERFRGTYNHGCGHWHNNMQGVYAIFRLAFKKQTIKGLADVDGEEIESLHNELFALIDKYRENQDQ